MLDDNKQQKIKSPIMFLSGLFIYHFGYSSSGLGSQPVHPPHPPIVFSLYTYKC
jgi:hypothetical protein